MGNIRIGTVDIPDRVERERYFTELDYLEFSGLFAGAMKQAAMQKWGEIAPHGSLGLVAPYVLTHRQAPKSTKLWPTDPKAGDFRDSPSGRAAVTHLVDAVEAMGAGCMVFRSPPLFAPSAANRATLQKFFGEVVADLKCTKVWVPDGLWEPRTAVAFATEIGVVCAIDPLVIEPGQPPELLESLDLGDVEALYLRVSGLGRASPLGTEALDELAGLIESYDAADITVAFDSPSRWNDAKNLTKVMGTSLSPD